ncbi:MAG: diadenylate cyclase CdaA [Candidatus Hydrogenedentota bacterium]
MFDLIRYFFDNFWINLLDILIVVLFYYYILSLFKTPRVVALLKGFLIIILILLLSFFIKLKTVMALFKEFWSVSVVVLAVIFQPEIRKGLTRIGQRKLWNLMIRERKTAVEEIVKAVKVMARKKIGALIVIERSVQLDSYIESGSGVILNARVSAELIITIFTQTTPLHDGAIIVREDMILASSCILPVSRDENLEKEYGTRHRAAIAMSDETDSLVIVVSEETGTISVAVSGNITSRDIDAEMLKEMMYMYLHLQEE